MNIDEIIRQGIKETVGKAADKAVEMVGDDPDKCSAIPHEFFRLELYLANAWEQFLADRVGTEEA